MANSIQTIENSSPLPVFTFIVVSNYLLQVMPFSCFFKVTTPQIAAPPSFVQNKCQCSTLQISSEPGLERLEQSQFRSYCSSETSNNIINAIADCHLAIALDGELKRKIHCISRSATRRPITVEDAFRSEAKFENLGPGKQVVRVNLDTLLDNIVLAMRTPARQDVFRFKGQVKNLFGQLLLCKGFCEIENPKIIAGVSEGGAAVFKFEYKKHPACLAQSPQLHKQMAICGDFQRVFMVGPVFRTEDSDTPSNLCEYTGLDVEMEINENYSEVMDIVDNLFNEMFGKLNEICQKEIEAIGKQYPFKPLKF
ncbi:hypothetical protein CTI12_AA258110 [Artemisia annua]|uniref:aspartate--tRNA ligase n=1 Tax=Artemisia annua TaxID=35608 RepID=A0A2U1NJI1_ARTAN|nr:hypothetical protein CTI12_AA258110 [Artemisia annua]